MLKILALAAVALVLTGCAGVRTLNSDVSSYGPWPADRKAATYAFERLPSQEEHADRQKLVEDSARGALEAAGFVPATTVDAAQVKVQVGARVGTYDRWAYYDPFWNNLGVGYSIGFHRGFGRTRWGLGFGGGYGYGYSNWPQFEREVAVLIRDQKTGQLLYEARARNSGASATIDPLLPAMFAAALKDFPVGGPNPRSVNIELTKQ